MRKFLKSSRVCSLISISIHETHNFLILFTLFSSMKWVFANSIHKTLSLPFLSFFIHFPSGFLFSSLLSSNNIVSSFSKITSSNIILGPSPVDGIYLPNILALWRQKTCIEKNPEFETRKPERLSSTFHWIYQHQKRMKLLV